ncbi:MAG: hypothetical protein B7Z80_23155 [Rhodospirillales bacterium 20-64-7]|nr:MAG: hypothetical protein B7Z80_23155 [Rhodospirillales bacterium 20-64-7]
MRQVEIMRTGENSESRVVVAIPVRDEQEYIGLCLGALRQQTRRAEVILLLLNNCTDDTRARCHAWETALPELRVTECMLGPVQASAGAARRLALNLACSLDEADIVMTTDADAVPAPDWIARNLAAIAAGAEVVCGMARLVPADAAALPERLHEAHRQEALCLEALDALIAQIDPDPYDPWPRHQEHSGASIAVSRAALLRAGGAPNVPSGEDRELIARLRLVDARIRHAPDISVEVSGRILGRASGGMAEAIRRRLQHGPELLADAALEPAIDAYRRAHARARLRQVRCCGRGAQALGADLLVGAPAIHQALQKRFLGAAWAEIETISPVLQRRRVPTAELEREARQARWLRAQLAAQPECPDCGKADPCEGGVTVGI